MKQAAAVALLSVGLAVTTLAPAGAALKSRDLPTITFAEATANVNVLPIWVGQSTGIFANNGLNVSYFTASSATISTVLASGSANFIADQSAQFFQSRVQGLPVEAISEFDNGESIFLIIGTAFAQAHGITTKTPLATVAQDLIGSTGGSSSVATTGQMTALMSSYHVSIGQMSVATFATLPGVVTAFGKGSISWYVASAPSPQQEQAAGAGIIIASHVNAKAWQQKAISFSLVTTNAYANANPGTTRKVTAAIDQAVLYVHNHEQKSVSILQANLPGVTRPILLQAIESVQWPTSGKMNTNIWRSTIAYQIKTRQIAAGTVHMTEGVDWTNKFVTH